VQRSFSNKPRASGKFSDFFEKIENYVAIISGPAIELHGANPYTYRTVTNASLDSVFKFHDTLISRAEITDLSAEFKNDVVAVIGLGGTGAYLLDFLVKTPVREIRAFDLDPYYVHYQSRYDNFRTGLTARPKFIDASCSEDLDGVTFAFVCVDKGSSRAGIFDLLLSKSIPFIDVGMGLRRKKGSLHGMLRTTYYSAQDGRKLREKGLSEFSDSPDDIYKTDIQIAELNALNASLAIIKFKQLRDFYLEEIPYYHLLLEIADLKIIGASTSDED
jgi:hypothetical protein